MNSKNDLLNYKSIAFSGSEKTIHIDADAIAWGQQVLQSLHLGCLDDFEKAQKICAYVSDTLAYNFKRSLSVPEIVKRKGGNCVSHTLIGIFLLRLAGIPAKFAHEVHITKQFKLISLYVGLWAKKENSGINSFWHNDHVWVWFRNADTWEPFDTALGICGYHQFYNKRFFNQTELDEGFAQAWTGPPFVIWEGTGAGFAGMKNITSSIINSDSIMALSLKNELLELVNLFVDWEQDDFYQAYIPKQLLRKIKTFSIQWFKK